jgi:large subunit ribosomal protein L13
MKTAMISKNDIERKWYVVDAKDKVLGRVATKVATLLLGKNKPNYSTNLDTGDYVIVLNAKDVTLSGNKEWTKEYFSHSTYPGGGKTISYQEALEKDPAFPFLKAVKGMLPKNARGREIIKKLHVYGNETHPHSAQKPEFIDV